MFASNHVREQQSWKCKVEVKSIQMWGLTESNLEELCGGEPSPHEGTVSEDNLEVFLEEIDAE